MRRKKKVDSEVWRERYRMIQVAKVQDKKMTIDIDSARELVKVFGKGIMKDLRIVQKEIGKKDEQP